MLNTGQAPDVAALAGEVRALFQEARRRRRRRWLTAVTLVMLAGIVGVASALTWMQRGAGHQVSGGRRTGAAATGQARPAVVWVDGNARLHLGVIGADGLLSQRIVGEANAASEPLVAIGRRVYWVDPAGTNVPSLGRWSQVVRVLNLGTGRLTLAGAGQTVFLSADRRYLLMSQWPDSLTETPVPAVGEDRLLGVREGDQACWHTADLITITLQVLTTHWLFLLLRLCLCGKAKDITR